MPADDERQNAAKASADPPPPLQRDVNNVGPPTGSQGSSSGRRRGRSAPRSRCSMDTHWPPPSYAGSGWVRPRHSTPRYRAPHRPPRRADHVARPRHEAYDHDWDHDHDHDHDHDGDHDHRSPMCTDRGQVRGIFERFLACGETGHPVVFAEVRDTVIVDPRLEPPRPFPAAPGIHVSTGSGRPYPGLPGPGLSSDDGLTSSPG